MARKAPLTSVFVVSASYDRERGTLIAAYSTRPAAEQLAAACEAYDRTRPVCPEIEDTPENDLAWERYLAAVDTWAKAHPAGEAHMCDGYEVTELPLDPAR